MSYLLLLIKTVIRCMVYAEQICLIIRAVMSWFPGIDDGAFGDFIFAVTEPLVAFVRSIVLKVRFFRDLPIDISLFLSCVLLSILLTFL